MADFMSAGYQFWKSLDLSESCSPSFWSPFAKRRRIRSNCSSSISPAAYLRCRISTGSCCEPPGSGGTPESFRCAYRHSHHSDNYLLAGLVRCACCGYAYTTASTRKKGKTYRYYRCITRDKSGRNACPAGPLPADAIEAFVVERIRETVASPENALALAAPVRERVDIKRRELTEEQRTLRKRTARLSADADRLVATLNETAGAVRQHVEQHLETAAAELDASHVRLQEVERRVEALMVAEEEAKWVEKALVNFSDLWDVMTPANRRRLVESLVSEVVVDEPAGRINAKMVELFPENDDDAGLLESEETEAASSATTEVS